MIALYWAMPSDISNYGIIESQNLYHKTYEEGITGETTILSAQHTA